MRRFPSVLVSLVAAAAGVVHVAARPLVSSRFPVYKCQNYTEHFDDPAVIVNATTWNGDATKGPVWISEYDPSHLIVENGTAEFYLIPDMRPNDFGNAYGWPVAITSSMWIGQGKVCSRFRAGRGGGIVTAFMLATYVSDIEVDDELDWEIVGKPEWLQDAQTNYFALGKLNYNNSQHHYSDLNLASEFNTYCFERTKDKITWTLNNETARVIVREEHNSTNFPYRSDHRLAKIAFSFWDGGSGSQGTSDWSGGPTNWENPHNPDYRMFVDWVSVECYDSQGIDPASVSSFLPPLKTAKTSSTTTSLFVEATPTIAAASTETEVHSTQSMVPAANPGSSSSGTSSGSRRTESPWTAMIIAEVLAIALLAGVYNL